MNDEARVTAVSTLPLRSMRLRPGIALQTKGCHQERFAVFGGY